MGIINFGIPEKEAEFFQKLYKLDTLVEAGTFLGNTAKKNES